jgi:hypothetical protein
LLLKIHSERLPPARIGKAESLEEVNKHNLTGRVKGLGTASKQDDLTKAWSGKMQKAFETRQVAIWFE